MMEWNVFVDGTSEVAQSDTSWSHGNCFFVLSAWPKLEVYVCFQQLGVDHRSSYLFLTLTCQALFVLELFTS